MTLWIQQFRSGDELAARDVRDGIDGILESIYNLSPGAGTPVRPCRPGGDNANLSPNKGATNDRRSANHAAGHENADAI